MLRKEAGFKVEQRIELSIQTNGELLKKVIDNYLENIKNETLTEKFTTRKLSNADIEKEVEFRGEKVNLALKGL